MIFERLIKIIAEYSSINISTITINTSFDELNLDSLDEIDILMKIEDEFKVKIDMRNRVSTVNEIVELVEKQHNETT